MALTRSPLYTHFLIAKDNKAPVIPAVLALAYARSHYEVDNLLLALNDTPNVQGNH